MGLGRDILDDYAFERLLAEELAEKWEIYEDQLDTDLMYVRYLYNKKKQSDNKSIKTHKE